MVEVPRSFPCVTTFGKVAAKQILPVMPTIKAIVARTELDAINAQWDQDADTLELVFLKRRTRSVKRKADALALTALHKAHWRKDLVELSD